MPSRPFQCFAPFVLGSITSRCSGKEPALLPLISGRNVDRTRESGGNSSLRLYRPQSPDSPFLLQQRETVENRNHKTRCTLVLIISLLDSQSFYYPEHVGFSIGEHDSPKIAVLEIHYDNYENKAGNFRMNII